jgi:hypothetical protein
MLKQLQSESGLGGSGLKTVELDWRKCCYEPIAAAKKIKMVKSANKYPEFFLDLASI